MTTDSQIRLALCITELEVGGAERCLVELAIRLDPARFAAVVYSLGPRPVGEQAALVRRLEEAQVPVHFLNGHTTFAAPLVLWRLVRLLRAQRPHMVQTFLFHANVLGVIAARIAGIRQIVTGIRVAERGQAWHLRWSRWTARWAARHICVSQSVADFSAATGGLDPAKLLVIPNGVDLNRFRDAEPCSPESLGVGPGRRLIVYIGRLDAQKGVERLIDMARTFLPRLPEHDLILLGRGESADMLSRRITEFDSGQRIHLAGWRADVPRILAAADLVILPSKWEGMSNVLLEAMAAGKPVVATAVEGVREALGPVEKGQAIAQHDSQAFIEAVVRICGQASLQAEYGQKNRRRASEEFDVNAAVARYAALYESLCPEQFAGR